MVQLAIPVLVWKLNSSTLEAGWPTVLRCWKLGLIALPLLSIVKFQLGLGLRVRGCGWLVFLSAHVGHAGVGLVSLRGAPLLRATSATHEFREWVRFGRVLRSVISVGSGRVVHVVVVYGFQGADVDREKLARTEQLFQAVMCELRVVGDGHPYLLLGDFNIEPSKIPCLAKRISEGLIVDFEHHFSASRGDLAAPTCKNAWDSEGTRRDFIFGNPAAFAACTGCWVDGSRWFKPHFSVKACLEVGSWSAHVTKARTYTPVWPALWLPALDKSKTSPNKEVQVVWKVFEERLKLVDLDCVQCLEANLAAGDSSAAWDTWAKAAERALADAYCLAGGPMPLGGVLRLGRGRLALVRERLGGVQLKKARPYRSDPGEAEDLAGQCLFFLAPFLRLRRRLKICIDIASSIMVRGFTVARSLELTRQWERVLSDSPAGPFSDLEFVGSGGLGDYHAWVVALYNRVVNYIRNIVIHRRDHNIKAWRAWVLEDRSSHPYRWLRPDLVPPAPILSVRDSSGNNVFHTDPWQIDGELRKAWMPFFCRADRGAACEDAFLKEVGDRLPRLPVVDLPPLSGQILYDAVARKYASAVVVFCWEGCELLSVYDDSRCRCLGSWTIVGRRVW